jgi:hypothetical protein
MAIIRRRLSNLQDTLQAQQNEEELIRRRAALKQQQQQQFDSIIPTAVSGLASFQDQMQKRADADLARQQKEEDRIYDLAKFADVGAYSEEEQIAKLAQAQAEKELQSQAPQPIEAPKPPPVIKQVVAEQTPAPAPVQPQPKSVADIIYDPIERQKRIDAQKQPIVPALPPEAIAPKSARDILMQTPANVLGSGKEIVEKVNYSAPLTEPQKSVKEEPNPAIINGIDTRLDAASNKKIIPVSDDAVIDPAERKIQQDQEKRILAPNQQNEPAKSVDDLRRVSLVNTYKPLKWSTTAEDEAKKQVSDLLKAKDNNVFSQLFQFGNNTGRTDQVRQMAEKIALKNIREGRNKIEDNHFNKWSKSQDNLINASRAEEDIVLKQAQAQKALMPSASYLRISGDKVKDLQAGTAAIRQAKVVKQSFDKLLAKGGDGFPPLAAKNKIIAKIYAAGADTDASSAGGGGGGGVLGVGVNASVSQSGGGKYIDPKVFAESIDKMTDLELSPEQRQFMKNSILLAQATGKQLEGGRMTDADLAFYLNNLYDWTSAESMNTSFSTRLADTFARYRESYGSYTLDNPSLAVNFPKPDALESDFDLNWTPERFGFKDQQEFNNNLKEQERANFNRLNRITSEVKSGRAEAGKFGIGRGNTIKQGVEEGVETVKGQFTESEKDKTRKTRQDRLAGKPSTRSMPD